MGESQKKYRVQLDFDQQGLDELEALKSELRAGSRADTVRYGLGLLRWAADQLQDGAKILVEREGNLSGVVFPFLPTKQLKAEPGVVTLRREGSARDAARDIALKDLVRKAREQAAAEESHYETDRG
jgi:hypothetical protein